MTWWEEQVQRALDCIHNDEIEEAITILEDLLPAEDRWADNGGPVD
jgi:hypothetical protein